MSWLSSPKVRLALIVNGLYLISLFTPTPPHTRPRLFARSAGEHPARNSTKTPPAYAPPAPQPLVASKAATDYVKEYDQLDVYLTNDLTLVKRPGHRLLLSPTFTTRASRPETPRSVLLRFISFSDVQTFSETSPLTITADGELKLNGRAPRWYNSNAVRHPAADGDRIEVIEGVGVELPYETFVDTVDARQVIIRLDHVAVELTAEQIEALRDMRRPLPQLHDK